MKVGDLVQLSSYGKKLRAFRTLNSQIGIIKETINPSGLYEYYFVYWIDGQECMLERRDLKFARGDK